MNNFKVEIFDFNKKEYIDYTNKAVFPLKIADMLDEQLDESELTLKHINLPYINPLTLVRLTLINSPKAKYYSALEIENRRENALVNISHDNETKRITETLVKEFIVANDNAIEQPIGSSLYNHQLYLIECTKILEGYIGDSISFTNPLGNNYAMLDSRPFEFGNGRVVQEKPIFKAPISAGTLTLPMKQYTEEYITWYRQSPIGIEYRATWSTINPFTIKLKVINLKNDKVVKEGELYVEYTERVGYYFTGDQELTFNIEDNTQYQIVYDLHCKDSSQNIYDVSIEYFLSVVTNRLPLKKWTILDVINRIFDTVVPTIKGIKPKFRLKGVTYDENGNANGYLKGSISEKFDKTLAPEMTFTQMTLREMLKQVGGFVHGEPRVSAINYENGRRWYEIDFDMYGGTTYSNISKQKYVTATLRTDINEFCTSLDSNANNLVNRLDWASGVVVEPFLNGGKSLRTETVTVRMGEDDSTGIFVNFPMDTVFELECVSSGLECKITPYLFEHSDYQNLSSYEGSYPYSKAYALYYTQGSKSIKGLFFKAPHAIFSIFHNYSIKNVIESALGKKINLSGQEFMTLSFRVTYLPIYSARIRTNKQTVVNGINRTLAYNQGANQIETRYYGENLKGAIARMGNVDKTYTYNLAFLSDIPKVGTLFDDNYYISSVLCEYLPSYIKCTVSLSKDFNRLSQYVGISSNKRMWEVSERQAYQRDTVLTNNLLISENNKNTIPGEYTFFGLDKIPKYLFNSIKNCFVSVANVKTYNINQQPIKTNLTMPVLSVAIGNSILFSVRFEDNYSAGQKSVYVNGQADNNGNDTVSGYWGQYVTYSDYYGRFYYLRLSYAPGNVKIDNDNVKLSFPDGDDISFLPLSTFEPYIKYRKDSREIPTITMQLNVVTDNPNIIIGSALTKNCSFVNRNPKNYKLYVFDRRINNISSIVDFEGATEITSGFTINDDNIVLPQINLEHKAWAIVTERIPTVIDVEDETGQPSQQTIQDGGELVLGSNEPLKAQKTLYFHLGGDLYD